MVKIHFPIEVPLYLLNGYICFTLLGAVDIGGAIVIHTFGAYFGLAVSFMDRKRGKYKKKTLNMLFRVS